MRQLNLPTIFPRLKKDKGKVFIFDIIRKKYVILTPEERVRQHFVHYLITTLHYPKSLFRVEKSLIYNTLQKRLDILIYNRKGKPWMLVECKSSFIKLTQKAFNQIAVYNMTIGAEYLVVTNGMMHYCWKTSNQRESNTLLHKFPTLPLLS